MKRSVLVQTISLVGAFVFADGDTYQSMMQLVVPLLRSGDSKSLVPLVGRLKSVADGASQNEAATCRLIASCLLLVKSGNEPDCSAYNEATNLCRTAIANMGANTNAWQVFGLQLVLADSCSVDGRYNEAFTMSTNLLSRINLSTMPTQETNIWDAISCYLFESNSLTVCEAVNTSAAMNLALANRTSDLMTFTNSIPPGAVQLVNGLIDK